MTAPLVFVGIVGSREYADLERVRQYVAALPPYACVISGGARGVDTVAADAAVARRLETRIYWPKDYQATPGVYDVGSYHRRNQAIVQASDIVVAFWDGLSAGTRSTIDFCYANKVDVVIVFPRHAAGERQRQTRAMQIALPVLKGP